MLSYTSDKLEEKLTEPEHLKFSKNLPEKPRNFLIFFFLNSEDALLDPFRGIGFKNLGKLWFCWDFQEQKPYIHIFKENSEWRTITLLCVSGIFMRRTDVLDISLKSPLEVYILINNVIFAPIWRAESNWNAHDSEPLLSNIQTLKSCFSVFFCNSYTRDFRQLNEKNKKISNKI